ncbi:biotin transport system substrate-specific component [Devosia crocina]|uniref:Biotin transporter n=1 Tax=Devosia crocina TaxID=429728 RepID=A0A1I7MZP5_9HYPH|nr:biotin transporter BioY [Devosia crocina]SFV27838.1 biotin transport system substrate-specific component [Devosia crocina]
MINARARRAVSERSSDSLLQSALLVLAGTALLAISAHIQVPFWPVKLSMQSFVVLAIGFAYGSRLGALTVLTYILEGALGLPVFQSGAGLAYLAGPTGGYLLGFVLAAGLMGYAAERLDLRSLPAVAGTVLLAMVAIYGPGIAWLAVLFGAENALPYGLFPFVPGEALKAALATAAIIAFRR